MSRNVLVAALVILVFASHPPRPVAQNESDDAQRVRTVAKAFGEIMGAEDKAIPRAILGKATGIAIFPGTIKAGFVFASGCRSAARQPTWCWSSTALAGSKIWWAISSRSIRPGR